MVTLKQACVFCLVIVNIIFVGAGFALIGSALYFRRWMETHMKEGDYIPEEGQAVGRGPAFDNDEIKSVVTLVSVSIVALGMITIFISSTGGLGAATRKTYLLVLYIIILLLPGHFFLGLAVGVATNKLDVYLKKAVTYLIETRFVGIYSFDLTSLSLNYYMIKYRCCGVSNVEDFNNATNWDKVWTLDRTLQLPMACCVMEANGEFPKSKLEFPLCPIDPKPLNSYMNIGCGGKVTAQIDLVRLMLVFVFSLSVLFLICCIAMAIYIIVAERADRKMTLAKKAETTFSKLSGNLSDLLLIIS